MATNQPEILSGVEFVELWARSSADRVTPVYLPPMALFMDMGDTVIANGTWRIRGAKMAHALQTTTIGCQRAINQCTEATATIGENSGDNILMVDTTIWAVSKWTKDEVVAVNDTPLCVSQTMYLNLGSKKVFIVARPKATQDELCSSWTADRVSDLVKTGFKESFEYYQERAEQARAAKASAFRKAGKRITAGLGK